MTIWAKYVHTVTVCVYVGRRLGNHWYAWASDIVYPVPKVSRVHTYHRCSYKRLRLFRIEVLQRRSGTWWGIVKWARLLGHSQSVRWFRHEHESSGTLPRGSKGREYAPRELLGSVDPQILEPCGPKVLKNTQQTRFWSCPLNDFLKASNPLQSKLYKEKRTLTQLRNSL